MVNNSQIYNVFKIIFIGLILLVVAFFIQSTILNKKCSEVYTNYILSLDDSELNNDSIISIKQNDLFCTKSSLDSLKISAIAEINASKNYIFDANSMSFWFQVISILVIGLVVWILQKSQDNVDESKASFIHSLSEYENKYNTQVKETKKDFKSVVNNINEEHKNKIEELNNIIEESKTKLTSVLKYSSIIINSQSLSRFIENIYIYAFMLKEDKCIERYIPSNILACHRIFYYIELIQNLINQPNFKTINKNDKEISLHLLKDVRTKMKSLKLLQKNNYYHSVFIDLGKIHDKILEFQILDFTKESNSINKLK